jgi:outer membrane biosynthesis protein TonB
MTCERRDRETAAPVSCVVAVPDAQASGSTARVSRRRALPRIARHVRRAAGAASVALLGACTAPVQKQPEPVPRPVEKVDSTGPRARDVCPNYADAMRSSVYPRDAINRGLQQGSVVVEFTVERTVTTNIRVVRASDPAFAKAGLAIVGNFDCDAGSSTPVTLTVPFTFMRD